MSFWFEKHSAVYLLGGADDLCFLVRQPIEFPVRARLQRAIAVGRSCICMSVGLGSLVLAAACIIGVSRLRLHGEYLSGLVTALETLLKNARLLCLLLLGPCVVTAISGRVGYSRIKAKFPNSADLRVLKFAGSIWTGKCVFVWLLPRYLLSCGEVDLRIQPSTKSKPWPRWVRRRYQGASVVVRSLWLGHLINRYAVCRCSGNGIKRRSQSAQCRAGLANSGCVAVETPGELKLGIDV